MKRFAVLFLLFLAVPISLLPQQKCEKILLPTFVTNNEGSMVTDLSPADFQLDSRALPMRVVSWSPDDRRHRVLILLDVSGSMHGLPGSGLWNDVMVLVKHVASVDRNNSEFALMLFSDHVLETVEFSKGRDALRQRLDEISRDSHFPIVGTKGSGDTTIYDVLKQGIHLIDNPTSADSMLVITDGLDEGSKTKPNQVLALLSSSMVRVFSIVVDPLPHASTDQKSVIARSEFLEFVEKSGGKVFGPLDAQNPAFGNSEKSPAARVLLQKQLAQFYGGMLENGVLTIETPSGVQKTEPVRVSLSESARQRWKKAQIFFPHEIGTCFVAASGHG